MSETIVASASGFTLGISLVVLWHVARTAATVKRLEEKLDSLSRD